MGAGRQGGAGSTQVAGDAQVVLAGFGWYQVRRQRAGRDPLVEPSVFRHAPYRAGIVFSLVFTGSLGGIVMIFNVFLQNGLGFTPWHSAITTAPWAAGAFIGSALGGMTMARLGRKVLHAGLVVEAAGLAGLGAVLHLAGAGVSTADLNSLGMSLGIAGIGAIFFALVGGPGGRVPLYLGAAQWTALATVGLLACSFAVAFALPRRAR
jgi:hypothetical protein